MPGEYAYSGDSSDGGIHALLHITFQQGCPLEVMLLLTN
jgi:hypothetical protein